MLQASVIPQPGEGLTELRSRRGARSRQGGRACTPVTDALSTPHPHRCPRGFSPIRGCARCAAGGLTPQLPLLHPYGPSPAAASRPGHTHHPSAPSTRGYALGRHHLARLASDPCSSLGSRSAGLGSEMVAAAMSKAERACVRVCVCEYMCVCV